MSTCSQPECCSSVAASDGARVDWLDEIVYSEPSSRGIARLCDAFRGNSTLRDLDMSGCALSDGAVEPLVTLLSTGQCALSKLDLRDNVLSSSATARLRGAAAVCTGLDLLLE